MSARSISPEFSGKKIADKVFSFLIGVFAAGMTAFPTGAAEEIEFVYTPFELTVRVASLEAFAREGKIDASLRMYLARATAEEKAELQKSLLRRFDIDPVLLSRFFNSAMGADILYRLGKGITIQGGINGKYALRAAIVGAALDRDGLTPLNVLKKFPTNMQIQGELVLGLARAIEQAVAASEDFVKNMRLWTAEEAAAVNPPVDYAVLPDLRKRGEFEVEKAVWNLTDKSRERSFYVDVYIPKKGDAGKIPVIVFSHGLASRPEDYGAALEHLATHGFLVVAPQHIGSDTQYLKGMLAGYNRDIFALDEFIDRPKDIRFVIDELEKRNAGEFQGRLDLTNVGVAGHSFGGYTALAIAGARIDFENLEKDCQRPYFGLNVSILLECRALKLPRQVYDLSDGRVKAVFAANPVNRSIFGRKGIEKIAIPVLLGSGSYDPAANPIFEQALPFIWLTAPSKYLAMAEGQAHVNFTELNPGIEKTIESVGDMVFPSQNLLGEYSGSLSVAFFGVYIVGNEKYRPFLQSAYAEYLSQGENFRLDFISAASSAKVAGSFRSLPLLQ